MSVSDFWGARIIFRTMYIESPDFKKRKIVRDLSNPASGLGMERIQLANYVVDELNNNHKDDAAILERFRKQAQQYKRNLLHRKHSPPQIASQPTIRADFLPVSQQPPPKSPTFSYKQSENKNLERIPTSYSNFNDKEKEETMEKPQQVIVREIVKVSDEGNKHLIKMIERKDKQLSKQAKIIKKNEDKINDLRRRLEDLEHQKKAREAERLAALEQGSYERIKGFISSLSQKLAENHELLEQNMSGLGNYKKKSLSYSPSMHEPSAQPYSPPIKKHKNNSKLLLPLTYSQPNPEPKVSYNYKVSTDKLINQEKYGLNSMIDNLSTSRNRLDALGSFY